jgi:hypothetical protein
MTPRHIPALSSVVSLAGVQEVIKSAEKKVKSMQKRMKSGFFETRKRKDGVNDSLKKVIAYGHVL